MLILSLKSLSTYALLTTSLTSPPAFNTALLDCGNLSLMRLLSPVCNPSIHSFSPQNTHQITCISWWKSVMVASAYRILCKTWKSFPLPRNPTWLASCSLPHTLWPQSVTLQRHCSLPLSLSWLLVFFWQWSFFFCIFHLFSFYLTFETCIWSGEDLIRIVCQYPWNKYSIIGSLTLPSWSHWTWFEGNVYLGLLMYSHTYSHMYDCIFFYQAYLVFCCNDVTTWFFFSHGLDLF